MRKLLSLLMTTMLVFTASFAVTTTYAEAGPASKSAWSEKVAPNYVVTIGKAKVSGKPAKGLIRYSGLDKYGIY